MEEGTQRQINKLKEQNKLLIDKIKEFRKKVENYYHEERNNEYSMNNDSLDTISELLGEFDKQFKEELK